MEDPFAGLGMRVELVSTDKYFRDVSIALYAQEKTDSWSFLVRSFSSYDGIKARIAFILDGMKTLGGMETAGGDRLRYPCGTQHLVAVRRLFLQACKAKPDSAVRQVPLS